VRACGGAQEEVVEEELVEEEAAYRRALLQDDELDAEEDGESSSAEMETMQVRPAARHEKSVDNLLTPVHLGSPSGGGFKERRV